MISRNKNTKLVDLKVYAILLETDETSFLTLQSGFGLEDAIIKAKIEFIDVQTNVVNIEFAERQLATLKVGLFTMKDFSELKVNTGDGIETDRTKKRIMDAIKETKNQKPIVINDETRRRKLKMKKPISKSNLLMMEIVKNKDIKLLDKNVNNFTKAEIEYLKDKINK